MNPAAAPGPSRKILVVDDNEIILQTMAAKLHRAGYQPLLALDGFEAVKVARQTTPDVILLDINFPPDVYGEAWDGFHVLEWLRRLDNTRQTPVIMISSNPTGLDRERAQRNGVMAFFPKPIDHADLLNVIRDALNLTPVAAAWNRL